MFRQANLQGTDLEGANLAGARLRGTNLRGARVERASLALAIDVNPTGVVYVDPVALRDDLLVVDEIGVCPICHEEGGPGVLTTCEHEFHASCLLEWKRTGRGGCPMCRGEGTFFGTVRKGSKLKKIFANSKANSKANERGRTCRRNPRKSAQ